ncbi:MAG: NB-ARC domain-containing protein, partial [Streptomyces sp.]|uniref:NB-ARC domain-containing protein n=1 Tax=Streptomyces sp. TaxID=1931 RepID=UPI003D6B2A46
MVEPISIALGAVAAAFLQGAGEEAGRQGTTSVAGLLRRVRRGRTDHTEPETEPEPLPGDEQQALCAAQEIVERAGHDEAVAALLRQWLRERDALAAHRLPVSYVPFVDRREPLAAAVSAAASVRDRPQLHLFLGVGGIGKTELALQLAHALAEKFPDDHLLAELGGSDPASAADPAAVLTELLLGLDVHPALVPATPAAQAALLRRRLAGRRALLLLDDAHSAAQVKPLLVGAPGSLTIVTSRHRLPELVAGHGARVTQVGPLPPPDAEALLARIVGERRYAEGGVAARALARGCAGHPLALSTTAARIAQQPELTWEQAARDLASAPAGPARPARPAGPAGPGGEAVAMPGEASPPDPERTDVTALTDAATDLAYRGLSEQAAGLHRMLGARPWPEVGPGLAAAVLQCPQDQARAALA